MKALISQALAHDPVAIFLQSSVLVIFVVIFAGVTLRVLGRKKRDNYQVIAQKILQD